MKLGDLFQVNSNVTAWSTSDMFNLVKVGQLNANDLVVMLGVENEHYLHILCRLGMCYLYAACCKYETR